MYSRSTGDLSQRTVLKVAPGRGGLIPLTAQRVRRAIASELRPRAGRSNCGWIRRWLTNEEITEEDILAVGFKTLFGGTRPAPDQKPEPGSSRMSGTGNAES
jgi:hypothetical protein